MPVPAGEAGAELDARSLYFHPMQTSTVAPSRARFRDRFSRADLIFSTALVAGYVVATLIALHLRPEGVDRMMTLAERVISGHLDSPGLAGTVDSVNVDGRYYLAVGPLQLLPYLPFALLHVFNGFTTHLIGLLFGIPAALLALPLARAYGALGKTAYWIAAFAAFGSLLLYVSVFGDFYYLAQAESFLALSLFLIEFAGRRRPALLGALIALSFLARPTTILAAAPFGLALLWRRRDAVLSAIAFGLPVAIGLALYGWFNWARFGSPLDAGYAHSFLSEPSLVARRQLGLFSIQQVPENLRLALLAGFETRSRFPWLSPSQYGLSMLLVSPALVTAAWAGFRGSTARVLWIAAAIVAVPVFLYYGGGYVQYGFRYSLDFTPFLIALMALGSERWFGKPERLLIAFSVVSVAFGVIWHARVLG